VLELMPRARDAHDLYEILRYLRNRPDLWAQFLAFCNPTGAAARRPTIEQAVMWVVETRNTLLNPRGIAALD
jgi:hypothetical protein